MRLLAMLQDLVAAAQARQKISRYKLATYDTLRLQNESLRLALRTQEQSIQALMMELAARDSELEQIRAEFQEAKRVAEANARTLAQQQTVEIFRRLELTLTQLPTLRSMVELGAEMPAADVLRLVSPLMEEFRLLGIKSVGRVGEKLPYDPARHRIIGTNTPTLSPASEVIVRYVGYEFEGEILSKAQVTPVESSEAIAGSH